MTDNHLVASLKAEIAQFQNRETQLLAILQNHGKLVEALKSAHVALLYRPGGDSRMPEDISDTAKLLAEVRQRKQ